MKPRRFTALCILFVAIFAFWWGISVLSEHAETMQQASVHPTTFTLTISTSSLSTASSTQQRIVISILASSTPIIEQVTVDGAAASTSIESQ